MCGIMGYVGRGSARDVILNGLARQEYRGYDSAGAALRVGGEIKNIKIVGRVSELHRLVYADEGTAEAVSGIGHTRWATHGGVTVTNAHPHESADGSVVLVHNGIIENAREIRSRLEADGIKFRTETDTESPCQLLARIYAGNGGDARAAMSELCGSLSGIFSLVILFRDRPDEIWCARRGAPLVAAHTDEGGYCASDPTALLEYTHDMFFLEDGEFAEITPDGIKFFGFDGEERVKKSIFLHWDSAMAEKGHYEHFMRKEIDEQPNIVRLTIDAHTVLTSVDIEGDLNMPDGKPLASWIREIRRVQFVACGTSHYATLVARGLMESLDNALDVTADVASEYRYRSVPGGPDTLAVFVSQSGETADTLAAARGARGRGTRCIAVTNVRGSTLDREAGCALLTTAGPEVGVAATKTFTSQICLLNLLALQLLKSRGTLSVGDEARLIGGMRALPTKQQALLEREGEIRALAEKYSGSKGFFFIGRRESVPLTMEGALKLKEIAYLPSEAYAAGEMKHGPIAMLDEHLTVVALVPNDDLREKMLSSVAESRARGARIVIMATEGDAEVAAMCDDVLFVPETERELFALCGVIPLQLFAYHTARTLGRPIDMPRNLAKSVTVE
ncbi:MAG: glutamine--fructose-6-phosphate transaminase (isomerizing) [Synergistaceae bacterium]|jgi:glucosamine--fructose-6-phosphate aminotransferase (isomerizing)|nr:glutamine--fructose-6-phosphate transaminase (isomerizing) [Synergistaceae bacterium]